MVVDFRDQTICQWDVRYIFIESPSVLQHYKRLAIVNTGEMKYNKLLEWQQLLCQWKKSVGKAAYKKPQGL